MLKAYFDDSGTHANSDVIVMGGLIATEEAWAAFEPEWRAGLKRFGISKMHMSHCVRGWGEFQGWTESRKGEAIGFFSDLVCNTKGRLLASAVSRDTWDRVVHQVPDFAQVFIEPIDFLFNTCMRRALESRRLISIEERVVVTFDSRESNLRFWEDLSSAYERRWSDRMVGYAFGQMKRVMPLQAADMVAYESFVHQCRFERNGASFSQSENMIKLMSSMAVWAGFYDKEGLLDYARKLVD